MLQLLIKQKNYNLKTNYLRAERRTVTYIALDDTHKQQVQLWHSDTYWNDEFKNLGFCGTDNLTAGGAACTHYSEHIGYYDKDLNGLDGDSNTQGGFVFNYAFNCGNTGCSTVELTGADIVQFENSQWISTMSKNLWILY